MKDEILTPFVDQEEEEEKETSKEETEKETSEEQKKNPAKAGFFFKFNLILQIFFYQPG